MFKTLFSSNLFLHYSKKNSKKARMYLVFIVIRFQASGSSKHPKIRFWRNTPGEKIDFFSWLTFGENAGQSLKSQGKNVGRKRCPKTLRNTFIIRFYFPPTAKGTIYYYLRFRQGAVQEEKGRHKWYNGIPQMPAGKRPCLVKKKYNGGKEGGPIDNFVSIKRTKKEGSFIRASYFTD